MGHEIVKIKRLMSGKKAPTHVLFPGMAKYKFVIGFLTCTKKEFYNISSFQAF
jgi:hypothetical protein